VAEICEKLPLAFLAQTVQQRIYHEHVKEWLIMLMIRCPVLKRYVLGATDIVRRLPPQMNSCPSKHSFFVNALDVNVIAVGNVQVW
jgi:hypothetical protein